MPRTEGGCDVTNFCVWSFFLIIYLSFVGCFSKSFSHLLLKCYHCFKKSIFQLEFGRYLVVEDLVQYQMLNQHHRMSCIHWQATAYWCCWYCVFTTLKTPIHIAKHCSNVNLVESLKVCLVRNSLEYHQQHINNLNFTEEAFIDCIFKYTHPIYLVSNYSIKNNYNIYMPYEVLTNLCFCPFCRSWSWIRKIVSIKF